MRALRQRYENDFLFSCKWNSLSLETFFTLRRLKSDGSWNWEMAYSLFLYSFKRLPRNLCTKQHIVFRTNFFCCSLHYLLLYGWIRKRVKWSDLVGFDWLSKRARWDPLKARDFPRWSRKRKFFLWTKIYPLLTMVFVKDGWISLTSTSSRSVYAQKITWIISSHLDLTLGQ